MNILKRIIILIALPLSGGVGGGLFAQSVQSGVVLEYQGEKEKTPMAGVAITAAGAASTVSDEKGGFTLKFRTLKAGDQITFKRITKAGYEIMNKEEAENYRIARKPFPSHYGEGPGVRLILCRTALLNEIRDGYRTVAAQRYERKMKDAATEIEKLKEDGKIKEKEYNARLDSLESAFEEQLLNMETYIDRFARIDLSELDETEREIIALVREGRIDEAIQKYDDLKLTEKLRKNAEERETLRQAKEKVVETEEEKRREEDAIKKSMERQEELLKDKK